jgi:D-arabinose 5-phosphate isomerase GutQ
MSKYSSFFNHTLDMESNAIGSLKHSLDYSVMEQIVDLLLTVKDKRRRVITVGCGTSAAAAKRIAHMMCCVEIPAVYLSPADALHGALGFIQADDLVILLSKGGNTSELLQYLPWCKKKKAVVIAATKNPQSALAKDSDYVLLIDTGEEPDMWGMLPCCSTLGVIAMWDAIILTVMRFNGFTKGAFLLVHPGGATAEALAEELK